jgi:hypothetical protein
LSKDEAVLFYKSKELILYKQQPDMSIKEQVVVNKKGKTIAIQIPVNQFKKMLEMMEELEDIKTFDKAIKRKHQFTPFNDAVKRLKATRKKN